MIDRRELMLAGLMAGTLGVAEWLRPRRMLNLFGDRKLDSVIPKAFGGWISEVDGRIVAPETPNSLEARLYSQTVKRTYYPKGPGNPIMLLAAHGDSQSDLLQLHRPETCYPAVGLEVTQRQISSLDLPGNARLPVVELTAGPEGRKEDIVYWTRLGERLPLTAGDQRRDRLITAMEGYVGDGVLVRASLIRSGGVPQWAQLEQFMLDLLDAVRPADRRTLIGTALANSMI